MQQAGLAGSANTRPTQVVATGSAVGKLTGANSAATDPTILAATDPTILAASDQTILAATDPGISAASDPEIPSAQESSDTLAGSVFSARRIVFTLIAGLLLFTAIAKLSMLLTDPFADVRVGISKEILWFSVLFEFGLAFLNLRLKDINVLAFINTVVFASFGLFAGTRWLLGYGSCGCSGNLELPVWVFILIDGLIVAWFMRTQVTRYRVLAGYSQLMRLWNAWSPENRGRWAGGAMMVGLMFGMQLPIAAPLRAMMFGEDVIQAIVKIDDDLVLDQQQTGQVELVNRSFKPAKIVGLANSCRCFDIEEDPISQTIPANGRLMLPLVIQPNKLGPLHQRVELYLGHPKFFRMKLNVVDFVKGECDVKRFV